MLTFMEKMFLQVLLPDKAHFRNNLQFFIWYKNPDSFLVWNYKDFILLFVHLFVVYDVFTKQEFHVLILK